MLKMKNEISYATLLKDMRFCALDLETTGTNPMLHKVVEIGMISFTLEGEDAVFESLCNPGVEIPEEVTAIHGITNDMVADSPPFADIKEDIFSFMGDSILVGHNPSFDMAFLDSACSMADFYTPRMQAIDTVRLSQAVFPASPNHKLDTLCRYLNIELSHHRALSDTHGCMEVFRAIVAKLDPVGRWTLGDLVSVHGHPIASPIRPTRRQSSGSFRGMRIGRKIRIRYCDSDGTVTEREIVPREFIRYGKRQYVIAHCMLRNSERSFNASRIIDVLY
jgi:DNA polymerase III epsilon subunit family exonuclease